MVAVASYVGPPIYTFACYYIPFSASVYGCVNIKSYFFNEKNEEKKNKWCLFILSIKQTFKWRCKE